ncbi:hypothetical protein MMC07_005329 [Pseudocyphellaria aurata]|nr:hypothetical protein [Pseudocyphellaria aurata]
MLMPLKLLQAEQCDILNGFSRGRGIVLDGEINQRRIRLSIIRGGYTHQKLVRLRKNQSPEPSAIVFAIQFEEQRRQFTKYNELKRAAASSLSELARRRALEGLFTTAQAVEDTRNEPLFVELKKTHLTTMSSGIGSFFLPSMKFTSPKTRARPFDLFRLRLDRLESEMPYNVPLLGVSTTLTAKARQRVLQQAGFSTDHRLMQTSLDRPEIMQIHRFMKHPQTSCLDLQLFLLETGTQAKDIQKTIVFVNSVTEINPVIHIFQDWMRRKGYPVESSQWIRPYNAALSE